MRGVRPLGFPSLGFPLHVGEAISLIALPVQAGTINIRYVQCLPTEGSEMAQKRLVIK